MHGTHAGGRTRAAGGVTHLRAVRAALALAAIELAAAPAALAEVPVPAATAALPSLPARPGDCAGATAQPAGAAAPAAMRAALLCVINVERAGQGLPALPVDPRVEAAASGHARDMVRRRYFAHGRAGGPNLWRRLRRAGWRGHAAGEAIAYGCGAFATPLATLRMWLDSPPHRAILLDPQFRDLGIGVAHGAPSGADAGALTVALDFGRVQR